MTRSIATLTIALLIAIAISLTMGACTEQPPPTDAEREKAAEALIQKRAQRYAEAQTGEWEIKEVTDQWGDPAEEDRIFRFAEASLTTAGGESETVGATLHVDCDLSWRISFHPGRPRLGVDLTRTIGGTIKFDYYRVPSKIDGTKGHTTLWGPASGELGSGAVAFFDGNPDKITEVQESLEILFAWGSDGQRQSLTWTMDGLSEAFAEACGRELDAEEE